MGISLGEVVIADNTITGEGVVLAQRLEQLSTSGGVVVQGAVREAAPTRLPFDFEDLGEQDLKGFDQPVRGFSVTLKAGELLPEPEGSTPSQPSSVNTKSLELPDKPSIAVLPFENMSSDPEQEYFDQERSDQLKDDVRNSKIKISGIDERLRQLSGEKSELENKIRQFKDYLTQKMKDK